MNVDNLINDIDKLIENSRFYMYDSKKDYKEAINRLKEMKRHLEKGHLDKILKGGGDDFDDS